MSRRTVTMVSGVLGGLCWLARLVLDLVGSDSADGGTVTEVLQWAGLVLLAIALAGLGAGLVGRSELWLQGIVAVAFPLLVWSVLEVLHPAGDPEVIDGVLGAVMVVVCARGLVASRGERPDRRLHGTHAR